MDLNSGSSLTSTSSASGASEKPAPCSSPRPRRTSVTGYSAQCDRSTGIICDQTIVLGGTASRAHYPLPLRRVRFRDPESNKTFVFLTNDFALPALTIAALYRSRWQVEFFFKWIKQHLRIKAFYGTSPNAVKTQVSIAISSYV